MRARTVLAIVAASVLVAAAGCSASDDAETTEARPAPVPPTEVQRFGDRLETVANVGKGATAIAIGFGSAWVTNYEGGGLPPVAGTVKGAAAPAGTVSRIDAEDGTPTATIAVGSRPCRVIVAFGSVFVTNCGDGTVSRIDPDSNEVVATFAAGVLAAGDDALWSIDYAAETLRSIDPATLRASPPTRLGGTPGSVAFAAGAVWVSLTSSNLVLRIDPDTRRIATSVPVPGNSPQLVADDRAVWALVEESGRDADTLVRLDPASGEVRQAFSIDREGSDVALGGGSLWLRAFDIQLGTPLLFRYAPATGKLLATYRLKYVAGGLAADAGALWIGNYDSGTVWRTAPDG